MRLQIESLPESIRPPTRRGRRGARSQERDQPVQQEMEITDRPQLNGGVDVNQTGAIETVFVPAFIVQRQAESSQTVDMDNVERRNRSTSRPEDNPNIIPFDLDFDQNHEGMKMGRSAPL